MNSEYFKRFFFKLVTVNGLGCNTALIPRVNFGHQSCIYLRGSLSWDYKLEQFPKTFARCESCQHYNDTRQRLKTTTTKNVVIRFWMSFLLSFIKMKPFLWRRAGQNSISARIRVLIAVITIIFRRLRPMPTKAVKFTPRGGRSKQQMGHNQLVS